MFDPKSNNILDEQLVTSGLEMSIDPFTAITAGVGLVKGISSIAGASSQASAESAAYKEQKKYAKKVAKETNKYNKKRFEADKANFLAMREYNFETALTKWKYDRSIQKYEFEQQMRAYRRDQQNLSNTLSSNSIASRQAYVAEQRVMREVAAEQAFARQDSYIESLQTEGRARLGQAGRSNDRAVAMTAAEHGRNLAILDASFTSSLMQHDMNMFDIAFQKFGADLNARASAMLRPEKLPGIPKPNKPPEPVWVEPMEIDPSYVARPNTTGTIMGGITGAASAAVDVAGAFLS